MKPQNKCSLLLSALLALAGQAHGATLVWTNTSGGNWTNAANWNPNQVPGQTAAVFHFQIAMIFERTNLSPEPRPNSIIT